MGSLSRVETSFRRLKWLVAARKVEIAFAKFAALCRKAGFNPDQPRHPKGTPEGGRWSGGSGTTTVLEPANGSAPATSQPVASGAAGIGHNQGPPLEEPPPIPPVRPSTRRAVNDFLKAAARWLYGALRIGAAVEAAAFVAAYEILSWLDTDRIFIEAYQDPPKTLTELQEAVSTPKWGYDIHHIVEQTPARNSEFKFPESMINSPDNLVRIPTLKHWEINGWYGRPNRDFCGLSPRDYLRDKDWNERVRIGHLALTKYGVLKP